jgi:hypothetical protein
MRVNAIIWLVLGAGAGAGSCSRAGAGAGVGAKILSEASDVRISLRASLYAR